MMKRLAVICCVLWMGFIFYQSSRTSTESNELSHDIVNQISNQDKTSSPTDAPKIEDVSQETESISSSISSETLNVIVRKSAHAFEFGVLALLLAWVLREYGFKTWRLFCFAMIGVFLYAVSDEFHQLFVEGRSARWFDVMVDCLGGMIALTILFSVSSIRNLMKKG